MDGSGGLCTKGALADQDILGYISKLFVGKNYKTQKSDACCITSDSFDSKGQEWGFAYPAQCNANGPFSSAPLRGGAGCDGQRQKHPKQLTFCQYTPATSKK